MNKHINQYSFSERMGFSRGIAHNGDLVKVLLNNIPNAINVTPATTEEDIHGTDYWVERKGLSALSIDIKKRETDPTQFKTPQDDLALETYSDIQRGIIGWTRNPAKRTDYILWYFTPTKRWVLVPFPMLCQIFMEKWQLWKSQYKVDTQKSTNGHTWYSECVFVPRRIVWQEIYKRYGGVNAQR